MNFARLLGRNSGRATPSLRRTPKAYHTNQGNPAERHLSFAGNCSNNPSQLWAPYTLRNKDRSADKTSSGNHCENIAGTADTDAPTFVASPNQEIRAGIPKGMAA
jgi:hypothetical protein